MLCLEMLFNKNNYNIRGVYELLIFVFYDFNPLFNFTFTFTFLYILRNLLTMKCAHIISLKGNKTPPVINYTLNWTVNYSAMRMKTC